MSQSAALVALLSVGLLLFSALPVSAQAGYQLVANDGVPINSMKKADVSRYFLKKTKRWGDSKTPVEAFDLDASSRVREAFSDDVHGRSVKAIKSYWQRQIFAGRGTPPEEFASEDEVLRLVASTPGGFAYVSTSRSLPSGVKAIEITE